MDICLAKAGFTQIVTIAFGGAFLNETIKFDKADTRLALGSFIFMAISAVITFNYYKRASRISKKSKRKHQ